MNSRRTEFVPASAWSRTPRPCWAPRAPAWLAKAMPPTLADPRRQFNKAQASLPRGNSLYETPKSDGVHQWGMSIDLNTCIGCQRVHRRLPGGEQHPDRRQGPGDGRREMQWIRLTGITPTASGRRGLGAEGNKLLPRIPRFRCSHDLPALRARALRDGVPGQRDGARRGRHQRDGLQPLHRHRYCATTAPTRSAALISSTSTSGHRRALTWARSATRATCRSCSSS